LNISYQENGRLVRGLDYYNSTTFEISTLSSKSQNALLGGGRYDYLVESMGGPATPAVGFAAGIERLMIESNFTVSKERVDFFIGYESQSEKIMSIANQLIDNGYNVFIDTLKKSEKSQIKSAIKLNAKYFLRINDKIILKDLHSKKEFEVNSLNQIKDSIDK
jgi:histidyl-tRNA synthetase